MYIVGSCPLGWVCGRWSARFSRRTGCCMLEVSSVSCCRCVGQSRISPRGLSTGRAILSRRCLRGSARLALIEPIAYKKPRNRWLYYGAWRYLTPLWGKLNQICIATKPLVTGAKIGSLPESKKCRKSSCGRFCMRLLMVIDGCLLLLTVILLSWFYYFLTLPDE